VRSFVQFNAMDIILQAIRDAAPGTIVLVTIDHKQKVLQIEYREAQTAYFGKKGFSVCGSMYTFKDGDKVTIQFRDYVMEGYASQDNIQVAAMIEEILKDLGSRFPDLKEVIFRSDNASCFSSQMLIPYINNMNQVRVQDNEVPLTRWIYFEAGTGKTALDGHFSYLNVKIKSFVQAGNDVTTPAQLFDALSFDGGIANSSVVLLNLSKLKSTVNTGIVYTTDTSRTRKFKAGANCGSRATHDIHWTREGEVRIELNSLVTPGETIAAGKLAKWKSSPVDGEVVSIFTSTKKARSRPSRVNDDTEEPVTPFTSRPTTRSLLAAGTPAPAPEILATPEELKASVLKLALLNVSTVNVTQSLTATTTETVQTRFVMEWLEKGWGQAKNNKQEKYSKETADYLAKKYKDGLGKKNKAFRWSPQETLHEFQKLHARDWKLKLSLTVQRIKVFFSKTPPKTTGEEVLIQVEEELAEGINEEIVQQEEEVDDEDMDDSFNRERNDRILLHLKKFNDLIGSVKKSDDDEDVVDKRVKIDFSLTYSTGERIVGKYKHKWYLGSVISFPSGGVQVRLDDALNKLFVINQVDRIVATKGALEGSPWNEGDTVLAMYQGMEYGRLQSNEVQQEWWEGRIVAVKKDEHGRHHYEVFFPDDETTYDLYGEYILPYIVDDEVVE